MESTPAHSNYNPDLLAVMPSTAQRVIEVGCSTGALGAAFKKIAPHSNYWGLEIDPDFADQAQAYCDRVFTLDIEYADDAFWESVSDRDCWVFGDVLEHLKDPWSILHQVRGVIPANGVVVACVPNAQHWSLQAKLSAGAFEYEAEGLLDRTHLRWFTRTTLIKLFQECGFEIVGGTPRVFDEPQREKFLPLIEQMARLSGVDPNIARADALPLQYVIKAVPKGVRFG